MADWTGSAYHQNMVVKHDLHPYADPVQAGNVKKLRVVIRMLDLSIRGTDPIIEENNGASFKGRGVFLPCRKALQLTLEQSVFRR